MRHPTTKCPVCGVDLVLDENGDCRACRTNIQEVEREPNEELEFVCMVCEEMFVSRRDNSGYDQAACPVCGDISNTPEFHGLELERIKLEDRQTISFIRRLFMRWM